jgi:hypothetical protein
MHIEQMNGMTLDPSHAASPPLSARSSRVAVAQLSSSPASHDSSPVPPSGGRCIEVKAKEMAARRGGGGQRNMHCLDGDGDLKSNPSLLLMEGKLLFASPKCMVLLES